MQIQEITTEVYNKKNQLTHSVKYARSLPKKSQLDRRRSKKLNVTVNVLDENLKVYNCHN